jgi:hypothetical protein
LRFDFDQKAILVSLLVCADQTIQFKTEDQIQNARRCFGFQLRHKILQAAVNLLDLGSVI